jgi:Common central domain of tyrosinase
VKAILKLANVRSNKIDVAHETAAFLTWHRYFIHVFEVELEEKCGYTGSLT